MLRTTAQHAKYKVFQTRVFHLEICCQQDLLIICRSCGFFLAPLSAASHYMNVDFENYRFGNHFLVMEPYQLPTLNRNSDPPIFNTEEPFLFMYLKLVHCGFCHEAIGLYFSTANIMDNEWLLDRIAINMEQV
jgi:hypothetical protein